MFSSCLCVRRSVRPHGTTRLREDSDFENWNLSIFRNLLRKFDFNKNLSIITIITVKDIYTLVTISSSFLLTINVSDTGCSENQNIQLIFSTFYKMCLYEIIFDNTAVP